MIPFRLAIASINDLRHFISRETRKCQTHFTNRFHFPRDSRHLQRLPDVVKSGPSGASWRKAAELRETTRNCRRGRTGDWLPRHRDNERNAHQPFDGQDGGQRQSGTSDPHQPDGTGRVDYYAVYYRRIIQRLFENPPTERFIFGVGQRGLSEVRQLLERTPLAKRVPASGLPILVEQLLSGLMTHLRSVPIGMRVDNWIFSNHPDSAAMQKNAIQPQLKENMGTFGEAFRSMVPPKSSGRRWRSTLPSPNSGRNGGSSPSWLALHERWFCRQRGKAVQIWNEIPIPDDGPP